MKFLVVIEPEADGYTARVPDVDGCVARGRTRDQVERQMRAVLEFHLAGLRHQGREPPEPRAVATEIEIVGVDPAGSLCSTTCGPSGAGTDSPSGR